jgi:hypothetical protein
MCAAINNPISCEVRAVIWFLHAKQISAADIHHELCVVYGPNIMSAGSVSGVECSEMVGQMFTMMSGVVSLSLRDCYT